MIPGLRTEIYYSFYHSQIVVKGSLSSPVDVTLILNHQVVEKEKCLKTNKEKTFCMHQYRNLSNQRLFVSVGLAWHSFNTTANPLKRLPVAASKGTMEPVFSPTRVS